MQSRPTRASAPLVAAVLAAVLAVAPVTAGEPRAQTERPPKAIPTSVAPYSPGRPITVNTDMLSASDYPAWAIDEFLAAKTPLPPLGAAFAKAERDYGINARTLLGISMLETGFGTSYLAHAKRNLFGFNALDRDPIGSATTFGSYAACVDFVARFLRDEYLSPTGGMWGSFPTLRAVNLAYATDPGWAAKTAIIANSIDRYIQTLTERKVRFTALDAPSLLGAGAKADVSVDWNAAKGAHLPSGLLFAVRWTPVAVAEDGVGPTPALAAPIWRTVDMENEHHALGLTVTAPKAPGLWRLEIDPRDTDGSALPMSDHPRIKSALLRVVGPDEAILAIAPGSSGELAATVRAAGKTAVRSQGPDGTAAALEAWALPLDATEPAVLLGSAKLTADIPRGTAVTVELPAPTHPAVVVLRLVGGGAARAIPAVANVSRDQSGRPVVARITVADPQTAALVGGAEAAAASLDVVAGEAGTLAARLSPALVAGLGPDRFVAADPAAAASPALPADPAASLSPSPTPPLFVASRVVVRTLAASGPGDPTRIALDVPTGPSAGLVLSFGGVAPGLRLVFARLDSRGTATADPALLWVGWIKVLPTPAAEPDRQVAAP
jgi:hypothetical protein